MGEGQKQTPFVWMSFAVVLRDGALFSVLWATRRSPSRFLWMDSIFFAPAPSPSHAPVHTYYLGPAYLLGRSIIATRVMREHGTFCEVGAPCTWFIL
jgi:hypothetical protein